MKLSHLDENNQPKMVDVGDKENTNRIAIASGIITMSQEAYDMIKNNKAKKGPVLQTAIIAGIMGTKKTSDLIPMCHPLSITSVKCDIEDVKSGFKAIVSVKTSGKTGVEMEALSGVSIALLTIYDMIKAVDKSMVITDVRLEEKQGGKSGLYLRSK